MLHDSLHLCCKCYILLCNIRWWFSLVHVQNTRLVGHLCTYFFRAVYTCKTKLISTFLFIFFFFYPLHNIKGIIWDAKKQLKPSQALCFLFHCLTKWYKLQRNHWLAPCFSISFFLLHHQRVNASTWFFGYPVFFKGYATKFHVLMFWVEYT